MRHKSSLIFFLILIATRALAGPGDTTTVRTFTFGSPLEGKFLFPDASHRWSKILMEYTLKCNPAQSPQCGEWDYLTYTFLYKHTGKWDSTRYTHPNFTLNGSTPDSLMYMNGPSWSYKPRFEYGNQTVPASTGLIGDSIHSLNNYFSNGLYDSRFQLLITKSELQASGLQPGQLTGLRFNFSAIGSPLLKLCIRLKETSADTLDPAKVQSDGFTVVFNRDHNFPDTGWQTLPFAWPFTWDGISGILVDISYAGRQPGNDNFNRAGPFPGRAVASAPGKDYYLNFRDMDNVKVPGSLFSALDSAVTVAFWQYGDPLLMPEDNSIFEGFDSLNRRVLNVHLPWSNSRVYWDAGRDSAGYDRINTLISDPSKYRGRWNHWAFTKDAASGRMKIFLNGQLFFMQGSRHKRMKGIKTFRIGSDGYGTSTFYDGFIDDFSIWNKALSDSAIRAFMYRDIQPGHPDYGHLLAWYKFNEGQGFIAADAAPGGNDATLVGYPEWKSYEGINRFRNFSSMIDRPCIVLEQGAYNPATLDSVMKIDTVAKSPIMIVMYGDTLHPYLPTDTLAKYPSYYNNFTYSSGGQPVDSSLVTPDGILRRHDQVYYGHPFELLERYELARYITPYGNNLSLGDGWTWVYDLTDYAPLLRDSVHLSAGNWQELLDVKFKMIEGTPPRDVQDIRNIYTGTHGYADSTQHNLPPVKVKISSETKNARLKMRITGHGFGGTDNCSEFCPRMNELKINGSHAYDHLVWRNDCGLNPLYPQGGTWLYDRAEWCPGAEVRTKDFELSQYLVPGDSLTIDYDLQPGYRWDGQGSWPYYAIESQLITYGTPNFQVDAALEEILSPNNGKFYNRYNPICGMPVIAIKNNGREELTNLRIEYGPIGGKTATYSWNGHLTFQDTAHVTLPPVDWTDWDGSDKHIVFRTSLPNGKTDEYTFNDAMTAPFNVPPTYENELVFKMKTNHMAASVSWVLTDEAGTVLYQNGPLENNTIYFDTLRLQKGCYRLSIRNAEGEGLSYWANMPPYGNGTSGYAQLRTMDGTLVKSFQGDFGREIAQGFTVGMTLQVPETHPAGYFSIYPNPAPGNARLSVIMDRNRQIRVLIHDLFGNTLLRQEFDSHAINSLPLNTEYLKSGIYLVTVQTDQGALTLKLLKE